MKKLLEINDLHISFDNENSILKGINIDVNENEIIGIVGESGSGKSLTALSILQLLPKNAKIKKGKILFKEKSILESSKKELRKIRGSDISIIFQDPTTALNPTMKIGNQITELLISKEKYKRKEAKNRAYELLELVGIDNPKIRFSQYPHQLSGGQKQRIMIAIALSGNPDLIIADEPTTSLDILYQNQILTLFKDIQKKLGLSIIFITHNISIVSKICDRIFVMYKGKILEMGNVKNILSSPKHPYTHLLLKSFFHMREK